MMKKRNCRREEEEEEKIIKVRKMRSCRAMSNVYSNIHLQAWNTFCKSPVTPARTVAGITTKIAL